MMYNNTYDAHPSAIIDEGAAIGVDTKIWHFSHIMSSAIVGKQCNIGQNVYIDAHVVIGNGVKIQNNVSVYQGVKIDDDVFIGPSVVFTNVINPRSFINRKNAFQTTLVGKGATIGANATIVCGIHVGQYCFIGAGAVVVKDVQPFELVVGNPAKRIGWVSKTGISLTFDEGGKVFCIEEGIHYSLHNETVSCS